MAEAGILQSIPDTEIPEGRPFVSLEIGKAVRKDIVEVLVIFRHVSFGASVGNGLLVTEKGKQKKSFLKGEFIYTSLKYAFRVLLLVGCHVSQSQKRGLQFDFNCIIC